MSKAKIFNDQFDMNFIVIEWNGIEVGIYGMAKTPYDKAKPYIDWSCYGNSTTRQTEDFVKMMKWALNICDHIKEYGWSEAYRMHKEGF